ncbi:murein biosynthesis integral membrane protein MurJ, partial [Treponema pallidum]
MKSKSSLLKSGLLLSLLTLVSRVLGLAREVVKSTLMGTSATADAFTVAFMIPNLFRRLFAENAISVAFIPVFTQHYSMPSSAQVPCSSKTKEFLSAIFTLMSSVTASISLIGILGAPYIVRLFDTDQSLTVSLTRLMFPYLWMISLAAFFQGMLHSIKVFVPSGCTPIFFNVSVIFSMYFLNVSHMNVAIAAAIGVLIGGCAQALFQLIFVYMHGFRFTLQSPLKAMHDEGVRRIIALLLPTTVGIATYLLNDLVCTALATSVEIGVAASVQYSLRIQELLLGIFIVSLSSVVLPDLSFHVMRKDWQSFEDLLITAIKIVMLITIPATFFVLFSSDRIITLVYKNAIFNELSVRMTATIFRWHSVGMLAIALNRVLISAFYAQHNSFAPMIAGTISFVTNIILATLLFIPLGGKGIAFSLSAASMVQTVFLWMFLKR